jgi:hypothetical protein
MPKEKPVLEKVQDTVQNAEQPTKINSVENLGQALDVLIQAADIGRQKGIYDFDSLSLIGQSIKVINTIVKANIANQTSPKDEQ